jgi:hypothetical protein
MDKVKLQERINQLNAEKDNAIRHASACDGAIQDCNYWIAELDKKENENKLEN